MKMPDCFDAYRILALIALVLLLAGCDSGGVSTGSGNNSCTSSFSQPAGFEREFNTFTIGEDSSQNPVGASLGKTLFRQFFLAARPADDQSNQAKKLYRFMVSETDAFAGLNEAFVSQPIDRDGDGNPEQYRSVRNGFDLFEAMIVASDRFESLQIARDAMASCARDTQQAFAEGEDALPGSIVVRDIRVREKVEEGEEADEWGFQVNYAHNPEPLEFATPFGANVGRVLFTPDSFVRTLYDFEDFTGSGAASGFKQPAVLVAGFNASLNETLSSEDGNNEELPSVVFESFPLDNTEDDRGDERGETDRWSWSSEQGTDQFANQGEEADRCIRVTVNYADNVPAEERVKVQFSKERCPLITGTEEFQKNGGFSYQPENPDVSQTR